MNVKTPQINANKAARSIDFFHIDSNETIKRPHNCSILRGIQLYRMISSYTRPVMQKACPYHGINMTHTQKNPKFSITVFSDATQTHPVNNFRLHQFFAVDADFIIAIRLWCSAYHGNGSDTRPLMYVSHIGIYECMPDTWLETIPVTEAGPHLNIKTVFHGCGSRDRLIFDMGSQYW